VQIWLKLSPQNVVLYLFPNAPQTYLVCWASPGTLVKMFMSAHGGH